MNKTSSSWMVVDPRGYPYRNLVADTHDQAIIKVLEQTLPGETYGNIRWGRSSRGTGALHYLWSAMQEKGWTVVHQGHSS